MISGAHITLLVGGSIAAYKSAYLTSELARQGARVSVAMTTSAEQFVSPLTFQVLSGSRVSTDMFNADAEMHIGHIALAQRADVIVVAPATANILAKMAHGIADDLVTTVLLAAKCPIICAPAMNTNMLEHPATVENIEVLKKRGVYFIEPDDGMLACGTIGKGRLVENDVIIHGIRSLLSTKDLRGSRVIVTAGPTSEPLDETHFISNRSSGRMGYAIAENAQLRGAEVFLVSGSTTLRPPPGVEYFRVQRAVEMKERVLEIAGSKISMAGSTASQFIFTAAYSRNFLLTEQFKGLLEIKQGETINVELAPTCDLLQELGNERSKIEASSGVKAKVVGFMVAKGKIDSLLRTAREKLSRCHADLMVGNFSNEVFEQDTTRVWLLDTHGRQEEVATADRAFVAARIVTAALRC